MLFERPGVTDKFDKVFKHHSIYIKKMAFSTNIQILSVAPQSWLLQPIPKHPVFFLFSDPLKRFPPLWNFVDWFIELSKPFTFFFPHVIWLPVSQATAPHLLSPYVSHKTQAVRALVSLYNSCQTWINLESLNHGVVVKLSQHPPSNLKDPMRVS